MIANVYLFPSLYLLLSQFIKYLKFGHRFHPLTLVDENDSGTKYGSMEADFEQWMKKLLDRFNFFMKSQINYPTIKQTKI